MVVDWLENNAHSTLSQFPEKIHFFADEVTWENTLHMLNRRQCVGDSDRDHMVTEMVGVGSHDYQEGKHV